MLFYILGVVVRLFGPALTIRAQQATVVFSAAIKRGRATGN